MTGETFREKWERLSAAERAERLRAAYFRMHNEDGTCKGCGCDFDSGDCDSQACSWRCQGCDTCGCPERTGPVPEFYRKWIAGEIRRADDPSECTECQREVIGRWES